MLRNKAMVTISTDLKAVGRINYGLARMGNPCPVNGGQNLLKYSFFEATLYPRYFGNFSECQIENFLISHIDRL